jgi:hypothetical protein
VTVSRASGSGSGSASDGEAAAVSRRGRVGTPLLIGKVVFAALVVATIGAFFISQHLKVTTPFISGVSGPNPPAINPLHGPTACRDPSTGATVSERSTVVSFYVVHQPDAVNVYVVDQAGATVRTIASNIFMHKSRAPTPQDFRAVTKYFRWNGRDGAGRPVAPGSYYYYVHLIHQQRTVELPQPVKVETATVCAWSG